MKISHVTSIHGVSAAMYAVIPAPEQCAPDGLTRWKSIQSGAMTRVDFFPAIRDRDAHPSTLRRPEMTTHTPGPWRDRIATGVPDHMISGSGEGVCVIPFRYGEGAGTARRNANARLIAEAPAMRALLMELAEEWYAHPLGHRARALLDRIDGQG